MKRKSSLALAAAFGAGIVAALLAANMIPQSALDPATPAQAQFLHQQNINVLSADNFFATASQDGAHVYLWYFERDPDKSDSRLLYVANATIAGPQME